MNSFIPKSIAALTGFAMILGLALPVSAVELVVVSWGGAYTASQQKAYHDPYMKMNPGVKIINDDSAGDGVAKLRAMDQAGNVTWDLLDAVAADAMRLCDEGLVEVISHDLLLPPAPDGTPASEDFGDLIVSECFIPQIVYSTTFGYRKDLVSKPMTSVCDVFDLKTFPGKRSLQKRPIDNMEWALMCDGVDPSNVYDVLSTDAGIKQAFAKLDTIKDQVIWWTAGAQTPQLLADGEVVVGRLADQAKYISYGPARNSSAPLVGKHATLGIDMAPHMPTDPNNSKNTLLQNYNWWADNRDDLDTKFNAWLAQ